MRDALPNSPRVLQPKRTHTPTPTHTPTNGHYGTQQYSPRHAIAAPVAIEQFYCDAMHKRGLCRRAASGWLAVMFVHYVETAKDTAITMEYE